MGNPFSGMAKSAFGMANKASPIDLTPIGDMLGLTESDMEAAGVGTYAQSQVLRGVGTKLAAANTTKATFLLFLSLGDEIEDVSIVFTDVADGAVT